MKQVDPDFRTSNPRVFAVGDVTGPPALASSAVMGGRSVSSYLFKGKMQQLRQYILETSKELEVGRDISGINSFFDPRRGWWVDSMMQCSANT